MWCARFGVPESLVSDQGSHFHNETVKHLCARMQIEQEFSPVYSPWINGTGNLNHTPLQSLGDHSPVEPFTGLPASSQLDAVIGRRDDVDFARAIDLDVVDEQVKMLRRSLHGMHKKVQDEKERRRVQDMAAHKGSTANFDVVGWTIQGDKPHSFVIQHLISGRYYDVHASRLKFYADSELNQTTELLELVSRQRMVLGVEDIRNHRFNDALVRWELQVSWMGLQAIEDSWEPLDVLAQDVPVKVRDYIIASGDDDLSAQLE
ncbi:hypothetical protein PC128_g22832 [Phytophthora cactorum]|nr:hypothetical protein PC128_g22832 [Phytophthora cactorum]